MTYLRIAAVALTILFAVLLIRLYGIRTTLVWAAAMTAFIGLLYLVRALGRDRHGRPLAETAYEKEGGRRPAAGDPGR